MLLTQKPIYLEDSIMQKGLPATAGSKILSGFKSPFDAAVVERLSQKGYTLQSIPPAAEFGLYPLTQEPPLPTAVSAVRDRVCDFALCNDFSGQNRQSASDSGLYYIHPTYGSVSRYGLIPSVSSMDTIGIVCKNLADGFALLSVIAGHDDRDGISLPSSSYAFAPSETPLRTVVLSEDTSPLLPVLPEAALILFCAELAGNISRYDGLNFGYRTSEFHGLEDLYLNTRTEGFTLNTKLSLVMGAMVLSESYYTPRYHKAMQVRRALYTALDALFTAADIISVPPSLRGGELLAPLCGLPSVGLPDGTLLMAARSNENALYAAVKRRSL